MPFTSSQPASPARNLHKSARLTGHPSHLLDLDKLVRGQIIWELNREFDSITTLDGSVVELQKDEGLIIRDSKNLLALAGVVGGSTAAVDLNTSDVFMEMAVYRSATIRKNSEKLKIVTEASRRLEKDLDPDDSELAFKLLYSLVLEHAGGTLSSRVFDYYPTPRKRERIAFDPAAPSAFAGIPIATETSLSILRNLGFLVAEEGGRYFATPPAGRTDIGIPQDLVEEVIRINGYDKIPSAELPSLTPVKNITPRHLRVADVCKDLLAALGYDEALSLAMSKIGDNAETNYLPWESITTLNSVNDLFPDLRQSLAAGMLNQLDTYLKRNVSHVRLFEVGKVFGKKGGSYQEHDALALLSVSDKSDLPRLRSDIERTIRNLGFSDVRYHAPKTIPTIANPHSCWDIFVANAHVGIIYKLVPNKAGSKNAYFAEVDLLQLSELSRSITSNPVVEITEKLVSLDANVELQKSAPLDDAIANYHSRLPDDNVWSIEVVDAFPLETTVRYTLRVTYTKLGDQQAKEIHLKAFDLVG